MVLFILCTATATAEARYILPDGWNYNANGQIVAPNGDTYNSIWDGDCMSRLHMMNWGYADNEYREKYLRIDSTTPELGDNGINIVVWGGAAVATLIGVAYTGKKARNAA